MSSPSLFGDKAERERERGKKNQWRHGVEKGKSQRAEKKEGKRGTSEQERGMEAEERKPLTSVRVPCSNSVDRPDH